MRRVQILNWYRQNGRRNGGRQLRTAKRWFKESEFTRNHKPKQDLRQSILYLCQYLYRQIIDTFKKINMYLWPTWITRPRYFALKLSGPYTFIKPSSRWLQRGPSWLMLYEQEITNRYKCLATGFPVSRASITLMRRG